MRSSSSPARSGLTCDSDSSKGGPSVERQVAKAESTPLKVRRLLTLRMGDWRGLLGPIVVLSVSSTTALWVWFGPPPHRPANSQTLFSTESALIEPTDRYILLTWWLIAIVLALFGSKAPRRHSRFGATRVPRFIGASMMVLSAAELGSLVMADSDPMGYWNGFDLTTVLGAFGIALVLIWCLVRGDEVARTILWTGAAIFAVVAFAQWWESLSTVTDPYHFAFNAEELASVAAGRLPVSNFVAQYSNVLPYLLAPFFALVPAHATALALVVLLALQLVVVALAAVIAYLVAGRLYIFPAVLLAMAPMLANTELGPNAGSYFQTFPLRLVLPLAAIALAIALLRRDGTEGFSWRWMLVGFVAGVATLNNIDFGLPVLIAVVVVVLASSRELVQAIGGLFAVVLGVLLVFACFTALLTVAGRAVDWTSWLLFVRVFGADGYYAVAMESQGFQISLASLFIVGSVLGFWRLRLRRGHLNFYAYRSGVGLALVSGWSLLTLAYAAGRSLQPTYVSGHGFQAGLVVALLLPGLVALLRLARRKRLGAKKYSVPLQILSVVSVLVFVFSVPPVSARAENAPNVVSPGFAPVIDPRGAVASNAELTAALADGTVVQALPNANLISLIHMVPSVATTSSAEYPLLSPVLLKNQCETAIPSSAEWLLVEPELADHMEIDQVCSERFALRDRVAVTPDVTALPITARYGDSSAETSWPDSRATRGSK